MSLHYLNVKLEPKCLLCLCYRWVITERNSIIYPTSAAYSIFQNRQIWIQLITACRKYCKRRYTNMHHWSEAISTTPLTNGCRNANKQLGPHTPFSVAVSFLSDQWRVFYLLFCTPSLAILTRCDQLDSNLANMGPQLSWNKFWNVFL